MAVYLWSYALRYSLLDQNLVGWIARLEKHGALHEINFSVSGHIVHGLSSPRVIAEVDAKMVKPPPERPFEGSLTVHSEISPMASNEYETGR